MNDLDYDRKLSELERLLNDPDSPMDPSKVWSLLAEVSHHERRIQSAGGESAG